VSAKYYEQNGYVVAKSEAFERLWRQHNKKHTS